MNRSEPIAAHGGTQVSLLTLLDRYGAGHRSEIETLWATAGTEHLVLFSDASGKDRAILPVGPSHDYHSVEAAFLLNIEGLRAVCHTPALGIMRQSKEQRASHDSWRRWHESFPLIVTKATPPEEVVPEMLTLLNDKIHDLSRREAELAWREKHAESMERRLDAMAHDHLVRLAELEQRELEAGAAKRESERSAKPPRPFDRTQPLSVDLPAFTIPSSN